MLLAIDIGNTNISFGVFSQKFKINNHKIIKKFDLPVKTYSLVKLTKKLKTCPKINKIIICSVVPKLTKIVQHNLKTLIGIKAQIIGKDLIVPIKNLYHQPKQLGQDRLVNAYAASKLYPTPLVVIDSGTSITLDVVSKNSTFLGGSILAGFQMSLDALKEKTALLPKVKLTQPTKLIGDDTKSSILSGIVLGTAASVCGLVKQIKQRTNKHTSVIGTGGSIFLIKKYSGLKIKINQDLTLKGINFIHKNEI